MTELETIASLLAEVGPIVEEIEQIEPLTEDTWLVIFDDVTAIEVDCDVTGKKLGFAMLLAPAQPAQQLEMYSTLLMYNSLKRDTGGFHMGMDGPDGNVHLMLDVCHLELDAKELAAILATMLETGEAWRTTLLGVGVSDIDEEEAEGKVRGSIQV